MQGKTFRELGIKVYEPKKRIEIKKERAFPILNNVSARLMHLGGIIAIIPGLIFSTIKGFFIAKKKIREIQMKREPVLDLRKNEKRRLNLR